MKSSTHRVAYDYARELVFDVDASDYQQERSQICECDDRSCCSACWTQVMAPELEKLVASLCNLGFARQTQIHAWFSGSRGFHVWLSGNGSHLLSRNTRSYIAKAVAGVKIDQSVTVQPHHMIRMPLSMHQLTSNIVSWIDVHRAPPREQLQMARLTYPLHRKEIEHCAANTLPKVFRGELNEWWRF